MKTTLFAICLILAAAPATMLAFAFQYIDSHRNESSYAKTFRVESNCWQGHAVYGVNVKCFRV